jgi:hypothetical protein
MAQMGIGMSQKRTDKSVAKSLRDGFLINEAPSLANYGKRLVA